MLTEYFYPCDRGGSEWSTYSLAKQLIQMGHKIKILTPNYGAKPKEKWQGITIKRFNIGKKMKKTSENITPFWHTNPWWFIQTFRSLLQAIKTDSIDIIHVQGKFFLPAAVIIGKLKKTPVVFTARDYQVICNLGFCLWEKNQRCSLGEYLFRDIATYLKHYQPGASWIKKAVFLFLHLRARIITANLRFFAKLADGTVCISQAQQKIFITSGFNRLQTIYNTTAFSPFLATARRKQLIFVGRLTPGKGAHLLVPSFAQAITQKQARLIIVGSGFLEKKIKKQINHLGLKNRVILKGHIAHSEVIKLYRKSQMAIFPSLWPEPFGRGALEAISQGTPIITSDRGGLPEIVQGKYGQSVKPNPEKLAQAIDYLTRNHSTFTSRLKKDNRQLITQFYLRPANQYQSLYYKLLNK